jgi:hypothetical protein
MPLRTAATPQQSIHAHCNARFGNVFPHPFRLGQMRQCVIGRDQS